MVTTVIFDLDDTLYSEVDYCKSGFAAVAAYLATRPGYPTHSQLYDAFWQQFTAGNYGYAFNAVLSQFNLLCNQPVIDELISVYRNHKPTLALPSASKAILDLLSHKYDLALLTDGFLPAQRFKVEALGIGHYFRCIVYTEELGRDFWKPSPAGFVKIISTLAAEPKACVYIADNLVKDFIAPNKLGFKTVHLRTPDAIHKFTAPGPEALPQFTLTSIDDVPALLERL
jgi:putative hydrolase of the HAD superfamily